MSEEEAWEDPEEELHREIHELHTENSRLAMENIGLLIERVDVLEDRDWRGRVVELVVYGLLGLSIGVCLSQLVG